LSTRNKAEVAMQIREQVTDGDLLNLADSVWRDGWDAAITQPALDPEGPDESQPSEHRREGREALS
jgi:hypothetical protein